MGAAGAGAADVSAVDASAAGAGKAGAGTHTCGRMDAAANRHNNSAKGNGRGG